jgi:hypothetical protein
MMSKQSNRAGAYERVRLSLQAREILTILERERISNSQLLGQWLGTIGLGISHQKLFELLERMEKEELVRTEDVDEIRVVRMLRAGGEVATGLAHLDWIAMPELPR